MASNTTVSNGGTTRVPTVVLTAVYNSASSRAQLRAEDGNADDFENDYA